MISAEDCEFIKKFEVANSEEKQAILTAEGHQVNSLSNICNVNRMQCKNSFKLIFSMAGIKKKKKMV